MTPPSSPRARLRRARAWRAWPAVATLLASVTCDVSDAVAPVTSEDLALSYDGEVAPTIGSTVPLLVSVLHDGQPVANPRLRVTSSDTSVIGVSPDGRWLVAKRYGRATLTVRLASSILPADGPAVQQELRAAPKSVTLEPRDVMLTSVGDTARLSATAWDANDEPVAGIPVRWLSDDSTLARVDRRGLVTAAGNGTVTVRAVVDSADTLTATVRVSQQIARLAFTPSPVVLDALGADTVVTVRAVDARGNDVPGGAPVWQSRQPLVAAVTTDGRVSAVDNGDIYVTAQVGPVLDSVRVQVNQVARSVVISSPGGFEIRSVNEYLDLVGYAYDRRSNVIGRTLRWSSLDPAVAQVVDPNVGRVLGVAVDTARIVATMDGVAATVQVVVRNDPVELRVSPEAVQLTSLRDDTLLRAVALNAAGDTVRSAAPVWSSTNAAVASVAPDGRVTAVGTGTARVVATLGALSSASEFTVTNDPAAIAILPDTVWLTHIGDTLTPAFDIRNGRGDALPATAASWQPDDPDPVRVSAAALVTARDTGRTNVCASHRALRDCTVAVATNHPASVLVFREGVRVRADTMTGRGQSLAYAAEARNEVGALIANQPVTWRSTNTAVATVAGTGVASATVTAAGAFGEALIIAQARAVSDTFRVVVRNLTLLFVDNSRPVPVSFGTPDRPYAKIQDAVSASDPKDTVFVKVGTGSYSEPVTINKPLTLLGDSAAFLAGGLDPSRLPQVVHDAGTAGITINVSAPVVVRFLGIRHVIDGPAIESRQADVRIEHVYVNPGASGATGRGIVLADAPNFAIVTRSEVNAVRAYGVRFDAVTGGRAANVRITGVTAPGTTRGAGVEVLGGSATAVDSVTVSGTVGPRVYVSGASGTRVTNSTFAGRHQLVRLVSATGATYVGNNTFDLRLQPGDPFSAGSSADGRSGLEVASSIDVSVVGNRFTEQGSAAMDAVRLIAAVGGSLGGTKLIGNTFRGGRYHVRSSRSAWELSGSRSDSAVKAIVAEDDDVITLTSDTLGGATAFVCVEARGRNASLTVVRSVFQSCTPPDATTAGLPAIDVNGSSAALTVTASSFSGANGSAVLFVGGLVTVRGSTLSGAGVRTVPSFAAAGALQVDAREATVAGNVVTDYRAVPGLVLAATQRLRVDSNVVARNRRGMRFMDWPSGTATQVVENDVADNDTLGVSLDLTRPLPLPANWWGDARGPRRDLAPAAVGDSVAGAASFDPVRAAPLHPGTTAAALRAVRGSGQTAPAGSTLPKAFSVRVVNASGRPVAGVPVTFTVTGGGGSFGGAASITATSNASGLAEATLTLGANPGANSAAAAAAGLSGITFVVTGS